jgi:hypothetical protein
MLGRLPILAIRVYQFLLSPLFGPCCRFAPSCSEYAAACIAEHGAVTGTWLGLKRIARCHPWGGHGYDPPPPAARTKDD